MLFFVTSVIGVVTGSNSLITVPVMFEFGVEERVAVATNMFGLMFMAVGGSIPFVRGGKVEYGRIGPLVVLTVISSAIGAALVGLITNQGIKLIVSIAMIVISVFILVSPNAQRSENSAESQLDQQTLTGGTAGTVGTNGTRNTGTAALAATYSLTFLLGIYGGLYSGGYVTLLTATLVAFFGMTYLESIAATKIINVFSSLVATLVFMWQGLVDYKLGLILGVSMFIGAYAGAHYASRMSETWLRRIFLATVFLLAVKILIDMTLR